MTTNKSDLTKSHSSEFSLELWIAKAWQSQAWWLWLLLPLSRLYGAIVFIRRKLYQARVLSSYQAPVPVMIVGNITVGGSGKTPLIIELVHYLQTQGIKVGVISRGYGGDESIMPQLVTSKSLPREVGDEPCLIVRETGAVMAVSPNRKLAIEFILKHAPDIQLIIADDGLQHYKLRRDIEWIVVDSARGFGNRQLLPSGFLREPISRLDEATVIYHNPANKHQSTANDNLLTMHLEPANLIPLNYGQHSLSSGSNDGNWSSIGSKTVYAVSGIGYPQRFFDTLKSLGFEVIEMPMPDHHEFAVNDLKDLKGYPIIITSKDAVKIAPLVAENKQLSVLSIWILPVRAVLSANCYTALKQQLKSLRVNW